MPTPWIRQGEVQIPGVTCTPSSLPPCTPDHQDIPGVSCQDKPKTMAQIVANVLTQAIMNYIDENQKGTPKEISVTTETMASLTEPEINVEPGLKDGTINAQIKLPGTIFQFLLQNHTTYRVGRMSWYCGWA